MIINPNLGEAFYNDAVLPFFLALKVYPSPMELIMIYQKTVPAPVFQMIVNVMALDVSIFDGCIKKAELTFIPQ